MRRSVWRNFDWLLLLLAVLLTAFGVMMIYSATLGSESLADAWRKQAVYGVIGLVFFFITASINYRILENFLWPIYALVILILLFTLAFGTSEIGAVRRFIFIGGVSIQPAFPALILLVITQAGLLARRDPAPPGFGDLLLSLVLTGAAAFLVFRQPNLSTATLYMATWIAMTFVAGVNLAYYVSMILAGVVAAPIIWANLQGYMRQRILNFLNPESTNPGDNYNLIQALISIGSGGLWGKGWASGTQSQLHFLRVRHTDFIFSVVAEEWGFIGSLALLAVYTLLLWRMILIAVRAGDMTGRLIVVGMIIYIFYQLIINLGMNLSLIPVAGLPLPFVSSGGSSLVIAFMGLGLVESVAMYRERMEL